MHPSPVQPFTTKDGEILGAWLAEGGWPRGSMDAPTFEGYLVGLLVWPVGVPAGAWLPPIWGGQGWKVPAKIASLSAYTRFSGLVVSCMHELDRRLAASPPSFVPTLPAREVSSGGGNGAGAWAHGFLRSLQLDLQGLKWRTTAARAAVTRIAQFASMPAIPAVAHADIIAELSGAVMTLVDERATRGPLGPLESPKAVRVAPVV